MSKRWIAARIGVAGVLAISAVAAVQQPAVADGAPGPNDVVGVGSDIIQNSLDFLSDGDTQANPGYNTVGNKYRLISLDATTDANGRNSFTDPTQAGGAVQLNPTVVLRAGTSPVQRPNGGGAGVTALVNDGSGGVSANRISFARSPNLPTSNNQVQAGQNLGSPLHTVQIADDKQVIATATTTNAPTVLDDQAILKIYNGTYTKWNQLPGNAAGSGDTILPLIPQTGAGVRTVFLNRLKSINNGTAVTLGTNVKSVQQNDPTTITGLDDATRPNAIVPFPVGRYTLLQSGYFKDPSTPYSVAAPPSSLSAAGLSLRQGTGVFTADLPYYIIFRESDYTSTTPWQPGSTLNWVKTLFYNPSGPAPFVDSPAGKAILSAAGVTPDYQDFLAQTS